MSSEVAATVYGGTRWRRFTLAFGLSFGLIATVLVLMARGVLATPVAISGTVFEVKADSLVAADNGSGPAFIQYGFADGSHGVAVTYLPAGGTLTNMDQTVCGNLPGGYVLVVTLHADTAKATGGLIVDTTKLDSGHAVFGDIRIGVKAPAGIPDSAAEGSFAQTADSVTIDGKLTQQAVYTQAGNFDLSGLHLSAAIKGSCPYSS